MSKTNILPYADISREECVQAIAATGTTDIHGCGNTIIVQGETGTGKSAMLADLQKIFPNHVPLYFDATTKEAGDAMMPKIEVVDGRNSLVFVPASDLGFYLEKPVILMLDEIGKATRPIQNVLCRVMLERRIGEFQLPEGSVVFGTTNLADEGFGDNAPAYMRNRVNFVTMRKPNAQEWIENFALLNNIHPTVIQSVSEFPQMLGSYRDFEKPGDNQYVFDPRQPLPTFCTPRSLELASRMLFRTASMSSHVRTHLLIGLVGERASMDIMAIDALHAELPRWEEVVKKPSTATVPKQAGAMCLFVYTAIQNVENETVAPLMMYLDRLTKEAQALFASAILRSPKATTVCAERPFIDWMGRHSWLYQGN